MRIDKTLQLISVSLSYLCLVFLPVHADIKSADTMLAENEADLTRASVVVVAQPEFSMFHVKSFSWAKDHADISNGFKQFEFSVSELIDNGISLALEKKSYSINSAKHNTLLIRYHVLLASEMDDTAFLLKYGLSPGLRSNANTENHQRGTLLVELMVADSNKVVWRGAVEVFLGLEKTQQGRQDRVNNLLVELFSRIPAKK